MARGAGWDVMVSHRSGETEDTFIADLVVGLGTGQVRPNMASLAHVDFFSFESDQNRRTLPFRALGQIQPTVTHRRGAGQQSHVRRHRRLQEALTDRLLVSLTDVYAVRPFCHRNSISFLTLTRFTFIRYFRTVSALLSFRVRRHALSLSLCV